MALSWLNSRSIVSCDQEEGGAVEFDQIPSPYKALRDHQPAERPRWRAWVGPQRCRTCGKMHPCDSHRRAVNMIAYGPL